MISPVLYQVGAARFCICEEKLTDNRDWEFSWSTKSSASRQCSCGCNHNSAPHSEYSLDDARKMHVCVGGGLPYLQCRYRPLWRLFG